MLQKGVQYIYEALHKRPDLPVQMEFFGPVNLTPLGVRRLTEVGTVHGAMPRSRLLEEFRSADVLLFRPFRRGVPSSPWKQPHSGFRWWRPRKPAPP